MSEPQQLGFWTGLIATAVTAIGGAPGALKAYRSWRSSRNEVKAVRADNEKFKTEVRGGLKTLQNAAADHTYGIKRIDAELRAQVQSDDRPIMQACDEGKITSVNPAFTRELGWTIEQMQGQGWITNAIAGMDQHRVRDQWESCVANGDFLHTDAVVVRRDGTMAGLASIDAFPKKCADDSAFGWKVVVRIRRAS